MNHLTLWLLPVISAFIGWFTIWIAIRMLFHPKQPVRFLGITLQGVFPKRQAQFATQLGQLVARELIRFDQLAGQLNDPEQLSALKPAIESHVDAFLKVRLQERIPMLATFMGESTLGKIKAGLLEEIDMLLPEVIGQYTDRLAQKVNIEQMVTEKVANFSSDKLEALLVHSMGRELRLVGVMGGVIGFVIGLIQVLLVML